MCIFLTLAVTESLLLAVMSYDRCMAVCNPLHYTLAMHSKKCIQLATGSWLSGIPIQIGQTCQIFSLHFCNSNQIEHFFCDIPPILKLACGDTSVHELSAYAVSVVCCGPFYADTFFLQQNHFHHSEVAHSHRKG
jgi:olfactory receptor